MEQKNMEQKKVLVIGGSGFIGHHIVQELHHDHALTVLCRNTVQAAARLPDNVGVIRGDIQQMHREDYREVLTGFDAMVFAAGIDERCKPEGKAREFFYQANVVPCEHAFSAASEVGLQHTVLLNSIFGWMDRHFPELTLAEHHPYIASRVQQAETALDCSRGDTVTTVLEVPWVFGAVPGMTNTLWADLVNYVRGATPLISSRGGAMMISAATTAKAVRGALHQNSHQRLPIGDCYLSWAQLLEKLCHFTGRKDARVTLIPDALFREVSRTGGFFRALAGIESGLEIRYLSELLLSECRFDAQTSQQQLGYQGGDLDEAIAATVKSVPENVYLRNWRKYLNFFTPD